MNIVYRFRLTKILYDQVRYSRQEIGVVLRSWGEREYKQLCDYVCQCRSVAPKYVQRLADMLNLETRDVISDIMHGRTMSAEPSAGDGSRDFGGVYLPEDITDRQHFIQKLTGGAGRSRM